MRQFGLAESQHAIKVKRKAEAEVDKVLDWGGGPQRATAARYCCSKAFFVQDDLAIDASVRMAISKPQAPNPHAA